MKIKTDSFCVCLHAIEKCEMLNDYKTTSKKLTDKKGKLTCKNFYG